MRSGSTALATEHVQRRLPAIPPRTSSVGRVLSNMKPKYPICLFSLLGLLSITTEAAAPTASSAARSLYAVNESPADRGSVSVYDIEAGHRLIKTIKTVPSVGDVRGVAVNAVTGGLYVAYQDVSG